MSLFTNTRLASLLCSALSWRPGRYLRNSGVLLGWMLVRAAAQAVTVLVLTRLLGAEGYGRFVAILAVATFFMPFAGMGLTGILLRDGARNPGDLDSMFSHALKIWLVSSLVCAAAAIALAWWWLPEDLPWRAVPVVVAIEVASSSLAELVARTEQARQRIGRFGAVNAGLPLARLSLLGLYALLVPTITLDGWLWGYAFASALYMAMLWYGFRNLIACRDPHAGMSIREGIAFATSAAAIRLQSEFNKPVLAQQGFALAGNYGAAQRVSDIASLPLMALQEALWPRLYAMENASRFQRTASAALLSLALALGAALWLLAPWLPHVLGADFNQAADTLRLLAWLPALQCVRSLCSFRTVAAHRTRLIGRSFIAGAIASILLTAWLVPKLGVMGAVLAVYISEVTVIAVQSFRYPCKNERQCPPA